MAQTFHRIQDALADIRRRLDALYGARLVRTMVFGSHARGEAQPGSDLDLLVVLRGDIDEYAEAIRLAPLAMDAWEQFGLDVQFVPFSEVQYEDATHPLMMNVAPEAIDLAVA